MWEQVRGPVVRERVRPPVEARVRLQEHPAAAAARAAEPAADRQKRQEEEPQQRQAHAAEQHLHLHTRLLTIQMTFIAILSLTTKPLITE
ncbi:MAG TPA: hypothetical protein DCL73_12310 [Treponema sp.]|nr:hypothetical protein [Treponema sp.]